MKLEDLSQKISNNGATPQGKLTSEEYNVLLLAVKAHDSLLKDLLAVENITLEDVEAYLAENSYITRDALAPYATSNSVSALLGNYLPLSSFTKDTIKSTLGISDWALASSLEWSAINSKPTDINGYGMVEYLTNLNNATLNKFFRSSFQASNRPAYNYVVGFTLGNTSISANYAAQLAIDYYGGVYTRYKASTEWSEWVELAPLSSVPTKLSQLTDDVVAGKYLPLSGGTVNGTFTAKNRVHIDMGGFGNAQLKFSTLNGSEIMLFVKGGDWRITDDNFSYFRRLLHSDNFSDYALPKDGTAADSSKFGGMIPRYYLSAPSGDFTDFNGVHWNTIYEYRKGDGLSYDNDPLGIGWGAFISLRSNKGTDGLQFLAQGLAGANKLLFRCKPRRGDVGQSNKWSEVASLDSNVASATKLATPRTIWGQSFDGTGDVDGDLTLNGGILSYTNGVWTLNGDLLVTGGVTQFAQGVKTASSIMDAIVVDDETITKRDGKLVAIGGSGEVTTVSLDASSLSVGSTFYISEAQFNAINKSRKGIAVVIQDVNSAISDSEWGQVISCYRQYAGSSVYTYRVSILHKDNAPWSGSDNAKLYNVDIMDSPQSSGYNCIVTSINNLY